MARPSKPPSQTWKTFLRNHAEAIAAIDMCAVPTLTFDLLFAFLVLGHGRRQLLWFEVTRHPTTEWLARQITEAFPWTSAPAYLVRDNDRAYGHVFTSRVRAMGIRDRPISPGSPWQNGHVGRLISMVAILHALGMFIADLFKSRTRLEAENLFLRHQLDIALRRAPPRLRLRLRSRSSHLDDAALAEPSWCGAGGSAGDHPAVASRWFQSLLALEIAK
ncbi:MAG: hypothetical protein WBY67_13130 [Pseudolabrys sp.]